MVKIVIVDDEAVVFDVLKDMLQKIDNQLKVVGTATSKQDAIEVIKELNPNLVFIDINMPQGSGLELLDVFPVRSFETVFITGYASLEPLAKKYDHIGFVEKPIELDALKKVITSYRQKSGKASSKIHQNENLL
ncbi:MAG TPA: response regulator [Bacteroidales bacterium]|nr:response regulator [Bacteroidales bacterium]HPR57733.1 response regulator [Bacteroidales bacterium]HRW96773.1 response regulator [Bacteroidales bacterium]